MAQTIKLDDDPLVHLSSIILMHMLIEIPFVRLVGELDQHIELVARFAPELTMDAYAQVGVACATMTQLVTAMADDDPELVELWAFSMGHVLRAVHFELNRLWQAGLNLPGVASYSPPVLDTVSWRRARQLPLMDPTTGRVFRYV